MWFKTLLVALLAIEILARIVLVGEKKSSPTYSRGEAVSSLIVNGLLIWGILTYF